jgi:hypothetical protein
MGNRRWTEAEDNAVRRFYPAYGARYVQKVLANQGSHRSLPAIRNHARDGLDCYARREGAADSDLVSLVEVHPVPTRVDGIRTAKSAERAARRDGVITKSRIYPHALLVPADWAERYLSERAEFERKAELAARRWITSTQLAAIFGVRPGTIQTAYAGRHGNTWALGEHLHRIDNIRLRGLVIDGRRAHGRFWNPQDARREVASYRRLLVLDEHGRRAA